MDRRVKIIRVTPFAFLFFSRFVDAAFGSWMLRGGNGEVNGKKDGGKVCAPATLEVSSNHLTPFRPNDSEFIF